MYKDGNPTHVCWYFPTSNSKAREQQQGRWLKFLNLPGDYKLISYHPTELKGQDFLPQFSPDEVKGKMLLLSPAALQPAQKYSTLLGTGWKQAQHYHSPLLMNVSLALQLYRNTDKLHFHPLSFAPWLFPSSCWDCGSPHRQAWAAVTELASRECSELRPSSCTETATNKNRSPSRAEDLSKWSAHFQS